MKQKAFSLALILAALAAPIFTRPARANVEVSFDYFQDALSPFGEWVEVGDYGACWRPTGVGEDWAPYTDGYWAYTDGGWTWVSYEDWGGITYHYGRWVHVRDEGWVWVPEYDWAPAWVSWRSSNDYVGWAPLPPEARWEPEIGFSTWVDTSYDIGPDNYRFCSTRDFGSPFLAPVLLPCEQNVTIIESTVNITNISFYGGSTVIFNGGPNFVDINRHCRRPIPALNLVREDRIVRDDHGHAPAQVLRGNQLAVFAPNVARPADIRALPVKPQKVIAADRINRGWGRVPDPAAQKELRKKLGAQTAGLTPATAPARPPRAEELSSIPKKADPNATPTRVLGKNKPPRGADGITGTPQVSPLAGQPIPPKREKPNSDPRAPADAGNPAVKVPQVSVPEQVRKERTANPVKPFQPSPRAPQAERPPTAPQTAGVDENSRAAEKALRRQQREQQAAEQARTNVQRVAEPARTPEIRQQPPRPKVQQADLARQQEAAQRASELRNQQAQQQRQQARQAEAARQSQDSAQRANEMRSQEAQQQRQQSRQADAMRQQQQEAGQRANESRMQQSQQARQFEGARQQQQRANEMRQQPRQQQPQQVEVRRQQPPPQQVQQPSQPARPSGKDGDDEKKKHRGQ